MTLDSAIPPAATATAADPGVIPPPPSSSDAENWRTIRALLSERIRRRWSALANLSHEDYQAGTLKTQLAAIADDARALWGLAERLDRALDLAFAPRARRFAVGDPITQSPKSPHPDDFKVR